MLLQINENSAYIEIPDFEYRTVLKLLQKAKEIY
jgi:hypothetical protein